MKDRFLYTLKTAKTYAMLSQSMRSSYYLSLALRSLAKAKLELKEYNNDSTKTYKLELLKEVA